MKRNVKCEKWRKIKMYKKSIMIDMDEVIVIGRFSEFLIEFLGEVDFNQLHSQYRQDLIKGREEEFKQIYQYKNLYKNDNGDYIEPLPNCVEVMQDLNKNYDVYIVTTYIWKENVIDASTNLKNKFEYLHYWLPFIDTNNFIFMTDKTKIRYDIGIDDRISNLENCNKKLLFTEFRNKKLTNEELKEKGIIRVNNWLDVKYVFNENKEVLM